MAEAQAAIQILDEQRAATAKDGIEISLDGRLD